jgi:prolyl-tRNA editing enzyme YbaK/EbsC (Cys-tRNA(Pro) deacylase)
VDGKIFMTTNENTSLNQEPIRIRQLRNTLDVAGIHYTIHIRGLAIQSAQDGVEQGFGGLENMAPTLILRTENGYLAALIRGDTRVSYKKIKQQLRLKNISLASPEQVLQVTGSEIGSVSLINSGVATIVDSRIAAMDTIYGGCGIPRHTLQINPQDLITLTQAQVFDFTEPK